MKDAHSNLTSTRSDSAIDCRGHGTILRCPSPSLAVAVVMSVSLLLALVLAVLSGIYHNHTNCECLLFGRCSTADGFAYHPNHGASHAAHPRTGRALQTRQNFGGEWQTFPTALNKHNVQLTCEYAGYPICCEALPPLANAPLTNSKQEYKSRGVGNGYGDVFMQSKAKIKQVAAIMRHRQCVISKEYHSSPYEIMHIQMAKEWALISDRLERKRLLIAFITSPEEIARSKAWLYRVQTHMHSDLIPPSTADDYSYLSYFKVHRTCFTSLRPTHLSREKSSIYHDAHINTSWIEWIEPLTVHARHPFSYSSGETNITFPNITENDKVGLINADYVLLQSAQSIYNSTVPNYGQLDGELTKHFLFDAGSSSFDSSMYWFTCGYSQRKVAFDRLYGFEMSALNQAEFWSKVPPRWKPFYQFLNIPIDSNISDPNSPLRFIKDLATVDDFVSLKLDIDHAPAEVPIAQEILANPDIANLIDEFFFELHFDCEILTGVDNWLWGILEDKQFGKLKLDRPSVMEFFRDLRSVAGVRAHFWP